MTKLAIFYISVFSLRMLGKLHKSSSLFSRWPFWVPTCVCIQHTVNLQLSKLNFLNLIYSNYADDAVLCDDGTITK